MGTKELEIDENGYIGKSSDEVYAKAIKFANDCHNGTNHKYNGSSYDIHFRKVYEYCWRYQHLIPQERYADVAQAAYLHDVIEDCRITYNDLKKEFGENVAELVFKCTNEKGRNRKERQSDKYYSELMTDDCAVLLKLCDRMANIAYSRSFGSSMYKMYFKEHERFKKKLFMEKHKRIWDEMDREFYSLTHPIETK